MPRSSLEVAPICDQPFNECRSGVAVMPVGACLQGIGQRASVFKSVQCIEDAMLARARDVE
ncbi:MAG: hypothetical protein MZV65_16385 [Chromatiales bacterium]|nr:hypothetical protein [Chromatiales bacterium]